MGKTYKQPYRKSRSFDKSCRSHGACSWCNANRHHATILRLISAEEHLAESMGYRAHGRGHLRDMR